MWKSYLLALLSGILYVFSFAPWDQAYLQWFAFIPLFFALDLIPQAKRSFLTVALLGLTMSVVICLGGFYWMIYATQQYGGLPLSVALIVFVLFCFTGQLQVPLFLTLRQKFNESSELKPKHWILRALLLGVFYAGIESLYPKLFMDTAGHAFYHSPWIRQLADLGGPFLLTVMILFVNELLYLALRIRNPRPLIAVVVLLSSISGYGVFRIHQFQELQSKHAESPRFHLALIQANIGDFLKVAAEQGTGDAMGQVLDRYLNLSKTAIESAPTPDAFVWPETAYPSIFDRPGTSVELKMENRLKDFLAPIQSQFFFGGYDSDPQGVEYNSLFFVNPAAHSKQIYHKNVLLMFGETLPFADAFPSMKTWFPTMGFFGRGKGPEVLEILNRKGEVFKFAPSICYEGLFTDHSVNGALLGADVLLNVTNDSWFGPDGEPYLHLALTQFRTIETRLPLVRSTNTGISIALDPTGETLSATKVFQSEILKTSIQNRIMPEPPYLKLARIYGANWAVRLLQLITLYFIGTLLIQHYRQKSKWI